MKQKFFQIFLKSFLFIKKNQRGFTFIEVIITLSVLSVLSAIGTSTYKDFRETRSVSVAADEVMAVMNQARSKAISQVKPSSCNNNALEGYKVKFCASGCSGSSQEYQLVAVCGGDQVVSTSKLPSGVSFQTLTPHHVFFRTLNGSAETSGAVMQVKSGSKAKTITVNSGSLISSSGLEPVIPTAPPAGAPIVDIAAAPQSIVYDGSTTLTWTTANAYSCQASGGWSGGKPYNNQSGEVLDGLKETATYTLTCTGTGGQGSDSVIVTVAPPPPTATPTPTPTPTPIQYTLTTSNGNANSSYSEYHSNVFARRNLRINRIGFYGGGAGMTYRIYNSDINGSVLTQISTGTLGSIADGGGYYMADVVPPVTLNQGSYYNLSRARTTGSAYYSSTTLIGEDIKFLKYKRDTLSASTGSLGMKIVYDMNPFVPITTACFPNAPTGVTLESTTGWKNTVLNNLSSNITLSQFAFYGSGGSGAAFELHETASSVYSLPGTILYSGNLGTTADNGYYTISIPAVILDKTKYYVFRVNVTSGSSYRYTSGITNTIDFDCRYYSTGTSSVINTGSYAVRIKY